MPLHCRLCPWTLWIEGLRTDQLLLPGIGLPVSQVLSAVIVVVVAIFVIYKRMKQKKTGEAVSQTK